MADYSPPVSHLLKLGRPPHGPESVDYSKHGIGAADVPELIRLVQDKELAFADSETPEVYAQIHAWRALGQLRAEEAIEPLLDLLADQEDEDNWSDWTTEEVPVVLGLIGPTSVPAVVARLERQGRGNWASTYYGNALVEIAKRHTETRGEAIQQLTRLLGAVDRNDPGLNGWLVSGLIDLKATEAWAAIEAAYSTGNVDESIVGNVDYVKYELGLGPEPPRRQRGWIGAGLRTTAKSRAEERERRKKAEKRKKKRGR